MPCADECCICMSFLYPVSVWCESHATSGLLTSQGIDVALGEGDSWDFGQLQMQGEQRVQIVADQTRSFAHGGRAC